MILIIDETTYTTLQNLSYAPQVDVTGSDLPAMLCEPSAVNLTLATMPGNSFRLPFGTLIRTS